MKERAAHACPLVVAVVAHAWSSGAWGQDAFVAALIFAGIALGGRVPLGLNGLRALMTAFFLAGAALGWSHAPEMGYGAGTLPRTASLVAVGSLAAAAARLYARGSWSGERATFVLGMLAVAASGATRLGPAYGALSVVYVASALGALRLRDPARAPIASLRARDAIALGAAVLLAAAITYGLTRAAPRGYDALQRAFDRAYTPRVALGFGSGASLGSMRDALIRDDEVLRVRPPPHAPPIDYLRGAAYDVYRSDGLWIASDDAARLREVAAPPRPSDDAVPRIARVRRVGGNTSRYFAPLDAAALAVPEGLVDVDGMGALRTASTARAATYDFTLGPRTDLAPAPPARTDLEVPASELAALEQMARAWAPRDLAPAAALEAIRAHLARDYGYSLDRAGEVDDPILDFLYRHRSGYCTYFATAMTLLARARGVPARLVAGYRVAEWSPVAGELVVREKNAHAWVEVWVDGAWRTYDPTPLSELPQDAPHAASFWTQVGDAIDRGQRAAEDALTHVTPAQLLGALLVLLAAWWALRAVRARRASRASAHGDHAPTERPLPCFEHLARALERRSGITRAPAESLERFARRLAAAGLLDAAALVARYAALRYGGQGDRAALEADVARFVAVTPR